MTTPPLTDLVAALHLLLSDLDTDSRAFVLREAFPNLLLIEKGEKAEQASRCIIHAEGYIKGAKSIVDGSSGLGHIAAVNAAAQISEADKNLRAAMNLLRIRQR